MKADKMTIGRNNKGMMKTDKKKAEKSNKLANFKNDMLVQLCSEGKR